MYSKHLLKRTHEGFSFKGYYGDGTTQKFSIKWDLKKVKLSTRKGNKVGPSIVSSSPEQIVKTSQSQR